MPPRPYLQAFLATARSALADPPAKRSTPLTFVVGNESADLDSLCSALLFAYLRTQTPPHNLHIPVCHLPRDDLSLRPEFSAVLKEAATTPNDVITLSELPGPEALKPEDTRWLLVDHNAMTGKLGDLYGSRVVGCVDHHADEGQMPQDSDIRVIDKTGSCMSLVVAQCKGAWDANSSSSPSSDALDSQLAHLAIAPILIDTTNLTDKNKTTHLDVEAVTYLESKMAAASSYDRQFFYRRTQNLKEDISQLSMRDILRKDYKEWQEGNLTLGTSSIPQNLDFLINKAGGVDAFSQEMESWAEQKRLNLVALLAASVTDGVFTRELLVWSRDEPSTKAAKKFEEKFGDELQLNSWENGRLDADKIGRWRCWRQDNVKHGRKQIGPMLRENLKESSRI